MSRPHWFGTPEVMATGRLPAAPSEPESDAPLPHFHEGVEDYQKSLVQAAVERSQGSGAAAARALGLDRSNLHRPGRRLGLR